MKKAILATKVGMTQIFNEDGTLTPVTVLQAGPCAVTQIKTVENDVYEAIDLKTCVRGRKVIGGPAPEEVTRQILVIEKFVSEHETV